MGGEGFHAFLVTRHTFWTTCVNRHHLQAKDMLNLHNFAKFVSHCGISFQKQLFDEVYLVARFEVLVQHFTDTQNT